LFFRFLRETQEDSASEYFRSLQPWRILNEPHLIVSRRSG